MDQKEQLETLKDIQNMMQKSARFLSLSGLSGVSAGIYALVASYLAFQEISGHRAAGEAASETIKYLLLVALACLALSVVTAYFLTRYKAHKKGIKMWDATARLALINLAIPLAAGGVFSLALILNGGLAFVAPVTLIFYGMALVLASRNTYPTIRQLGMWEIALGLVASFYVGFGLYFWAAGFGLLHIAYGTYMYFKFDRA